MMALRYFLISDDYGCSAGGNHEHRTISTDGLVVDVDAYYGIGSKCLGTLHHLLHGSVLGLDKHLLITSSSTSYNVSDAGKKVFEHVGSDNGFACYYALVLADGATFNLWGSLQAKRLLRRRAVDSIIIVLFKSFYMLDVLMRQKVAKALSSFDMHHELLCI